MDFSSEIKLVAKFWSITYDICPKTVFFHSIRSTRSITLIIQDSQNIKKNANA